MNTKHLLLKYGRRELQLDIPNENLLGIFHPSTSQATPDQDQLLEEAMAQPIGTPRLRDIVRPGQNIAIVTSDMTRPTPSGRMIPFISKELDAAGIPDEDVIIILALGLHRPMTRKEIEASFPSDVLNRYRVINHDPEDVVHLGVTAYGTPVELFRPLVQADIRICLGNIEFHYFAGYSGGAKAILPGCASRRCITANHSMMVEATAIAGRLIDNPVRLDLEMGVEMLGVDFILNVVTDGQHNIIGAFAGNLNAAHRKGCEMIDQRGCVDLPFPGDIVVASAGGFPKDINFYQAHKALESARYFVRQGGIIILLAECAEGFGSPVMEQWMMEVACPEEALERIQAKFVIGGHKVAAIALIEKRAMIFMVSSFPESTVQRMRITPFASAQAALDTAYARLGAHSKVIVLPEAGSILPSLREALSV